MPRFSSKSHCNILATTKQESDSGGAGAAPASPETALNPADSSDESVAVPEPSAQTDKENILYTCVIDTDGELAVSRIGTTIQLFLRAGKSAAKNKFPHAQTFTCSSPQELFALLGDHEEDVHWRTVNEIIERYPHDSLRLYYKYFIDVEVAIAMLEMASINERWDAILIENMASWHCPRTMQYPLVIRAGHPQVPGKEFWYVTRKEMGDTWEDSEYKWAKVESQMREWAKRKRLADSGAKRAKKGK